MSKITVFIDKGGVLIDNTSLNPQYRRLLGELLPTELGRCRCLGECKCEQGSPRIRALSLKPIASHMPHMNTSAGMSTFARHDPKIAIDWAGECGLRGVLVQRRAGEHFEDAVLRAFDEVKALL